MQHDYLYWPRFCSLINVWQILKSVWSFFQNIFCILLLLCSWIRHCWQIKSWRPGTVKCTLAVLQAGKWSKVMSSVGLWVIVATLRMREWYSVKHINASQPCSLFTASGHAVQTTHGSWHVKRKTLLLLKLLRFAWPWAYTVRTLQLWLKFTVNVFTKTYVFFVCLFFCALCEGPVDLRASRV